jgi:radical SAM-linked protein
VGVGGLKEYFDVDLTSSVDTSSLLKTLNAQLPEGLHISEVQRIPLHEPSLDSFVSRYEYTVQCPDVHVIDAFLSKREVLVERNQGLGNREIIDMKKMVSEIGIVDERTVRFIALDGEKKVRLGELVASIFQLPLEELNVMRLSLYGWKGRWVEPIGHECGHGMIQATQ